MVRLLMAILGVLLGITMTVLAGVIGCCLHEHKAQMAIHLSLEDKVANLIERVTFLEKRKALLAEAVATQPKPAGVGAVHSATRIRTWNQDAPYVEKAKG